ncbi:hypothetical protein HHL22_20545 [Hymenobacter sp. RP-2-7]|uniref:Uncharacterized protein n=1 Tax=Hymenobacter polaris TaxID=2682546 RepID=A0A7Y0AHV2_9BACT|nr:hypothetical protein [Hymenobacter polaris]NML67597.1 hypothetical protein [Hymenobacter polaris]
MSPLSAGPQFRYTLSTGAGYLAPQRLRYEPTGWDGTTVNLHRDPKNHGVSGEYSPQLGFVKDGKAYLTRAYQAGGVEADARVLIEQYAPNDFLWQPYYRGRVDFTSAEFTDTAVKVSLEQQSWLQKFLSRSSVKVDLFAGTTVGGSTGPTPAQTTVQLHSRAILQRYAASQLGAETELTVGNMYGGNGDASHEQLLYFGFNTPQLNEVNLGAVAGGFVAGGEADAVPIHRMPGDGELTLELALRYQVHAERTTGFYFRKFRRVEVKYRLKIVGSVNETIDLLPPTDVRVDSLYDALVQVPPLTRTWQLKKNDAVYLYADYYVHELTGLDVDQYQATITATMLPGSYLNLRSTTTTDPSPATGLLLYEAFERLAQALSDEVDVFRSDFFGRQDRGYAQDGPGAHTLLTGGFQVRGFPLLTAPAPAAGATDLRKTLFASWDELFSSAAATWALGAGPEWEGDKLVYRVEPLSYWYGTDVVLDLTGAGVLADSVKVVESRLYQTVEVGNESWQPEAANGLDEVNGKRQFTTPLTVTSNAYQALSKYSTSGSLLEATRRNRYDATATTDTSQDTTNFLVCLWPTGGRPAYETERLQRVARLDGVLSPATIYNVALTPARVARAHAAAFGAGRPPGAALGLRYQSGEGNVTVRSQLVSEATLVAENADVAPADLPAPLWKPEQADVKGVPLSRAQLRALLAAPTGRVRYRSSSAQGQVREGWLLDAAHQAAAETADFTLLLCAS